MQLCSVFSKSPINRLSYFHNLKKKEEKKEIKNDKKRIMADNSDNRNDSQD